MRNGHNRPRILFLDGIRGIAVGAVILFHYFSRWTPPRSHENLYPYGNAFSHLFQYGFYGVHLFFIVSGFVITLTLYRCSSALEFGVRRLARLWPSMALCSTITLLFVRIAPNYSFRVSPAALIPSLSFVAPDVLNSIFRSRVFDWVDGAYWSLFVEVRFYFLAALIYFWRKDRFAASMYLFGRMAIALGLLVSLFHLRGEYFLSLLFVIDYLPWFLIGIAFFLLENGIEEKMRTGLFLVGFLSLLARGILNRSYSEVAAAVIIPSICLIASRVGVVNRILSHKLLAGVGAASYSLYLLHQNLGVALIGWLGDYLNFRGRYSAVLAIVVAVFFAVAAKLIYTYWETPLNRVIVAKLNVKASANRLEESLRRSNIAEKKASSMAASR